MVRGEGKVKRRKGGKYFRKEKNREKMRKIFIFGEVKYVASGKEEEQRRKNYFFI